MPSIKGTASVSDVRARSKALKSTRFPKIFSKEVNLEKLNKAVLTQWIEQKVTSILGFDDEIVSSTAINLFLPSEGEKPDPKRAQLDLVGFLGEQESASFAKELWSLMLEAQSSSSGIPMTLLNQKKKELAQKSANQMAESFPSNQPSNRSAQDSVARHRNPETNRLVQEAARRAQAARQMVGAPGDNPNLPPPNQNAGPVPIPVSPTHPSDQQNRSRSDRSNGDRKMPPRDHRQRDYRNDNFAHSRMSGRGSPPRYRDGNGYPPPGRGGYGRPDDDRRRGPYQCRSSRSRSRSMGRHRNDGRRWEDDRHRRGSRGGRDRRGYYDAEREFEELERRLNMLKKQVATRGENYALNEEIEDVKDRLYELDERRRRSRRDREEDEYRRRKRRRHESSVDSHRRGRSPDSRHGGRRNSRSPDNERRSTRRSQSPETEQRRNRRGASSDSDDGSSKSSASRRSRSPDSRSGRRRRRSPSYEDRKERNRDDRKGRRKRSESRSSYSSSASSDYSDQDSR